MTAIERALPSRTTAQTRSCRRPTRGAGTPSRPRWRNRVPRRPGAGASPPRCRSVGVPSWSGIGRSRTVPTGGPPAIGQSAQIPYGPSIRPFQRTIRSCASARLSRGAGTAPSHCATSEAAVDVEHHGGLVLIPRADQQPLGDEHDSTLVPQAIRARRGASTQWGYDDRGAARVRRDRDRQRLRRRGRGPAARGVGPARPGGRTGPAVDPRGPRRRGRVDPAAAVGAADRAARLLPPDPAPARVLRRGRRRRRRQPGLRRGAAAPQGSLLRAPGLGVDRRRLGSRP